MNSDIILPTAGYYERDSLKYTQAYLPYLLACEKAVEPLGEAKPEWAIFGLLARKIQDRAKQRGVSTVTDVMGGSVDLSKIYERWSAEGRFHEDDAKAALDYILRNTPVTGNKGWDELVKTGMLPIVEQSGGPNPLYSVATDYKPGRTCIHMRVSSTAGSGRRSPVASSS
jgi:anaerobic selenocysteine-containing dehydrogenase